MNLVDSSAWLAYFADEPTAEFFAEAIEDHELLIVPSVCSYEVFKVVLRERGEDDAFTVVAAMEQGTVVDLDSELAMEAAAVGLEEGLAFADSVSHCCKEAQCHDLDPIQPLRRQDGHPIQSERKVELRRSPGKIVR